MTINNKITSPWKWVPTTFFMQGFPGVMMMVATSIMYKNLLQQISIENKLNGKTIIPENIYHSQFVGNSPVQFYGSYAKRVGKYLVQ